METEIESQESQVEDGGQPAVDQEPDQSAQVERIDGGEVEVRLPRKTRAERRAERDPFRQSAAEIERLRAEVEAARRENAEMRGYLARQNAPQQTPQAQQADPYKAEIGNIRREQEHISALIRSGQVSEAEAARLKDRFYELTDRQTELLEERLERRVASKRQPEGVPDDVRNQIILTAEFPEVMESDVGKQLAYAEYLKLRTNQPASLATARKAFQRAAEQLGLGKSSSPPPSAAQQARYGAVPSQAGAKVADGGVRLTKDQQKMAVARWSTLPEDEAYSRMAELLTKAKRRASET